MLTCISHRLHHSSPSILRTSLQWVKIQRLNIWIIIIHAYSYTMHNYLVCQTAQWAQRAVPVGPTRGPKDPSQTVNSDTVTTKAPKHQSTKAKKNKKTFTHVGPVISVYKSTNKPKFKLVLILYIVHFYCAIALLKVFIRIYYQHT